MTSDRPSGRDDAPRSTEHDPQHGRVDRADGADAGAPGSWDADDPQAWDEPESVRSGDAHGRESRDWQGRDLARSPTLPSRREILRKTPVFQGKPA